MTNSSIPLRLAISLSLLLALTHAFIVQTTPLQPRSTTTGGTKLSTTLYASPTSLTLFSPCKINLFLRILRKREDGYHDLASLFQAVGFGDTLELSILDEQDGQHEDVFTCNMPGVPVDSSNLVLRALTLMRTKTGLSTYFKANLFKECPAQAGLGGGSANAATAMYAANQLMGTPASNEELISWSGALGSDITFFLSRGTAYCTGRGEIMTPIDPPLAAGTKLVICKPNVGLSTPTVFQSLDYSQLSQVDPELMLEEFITKGVKESTMYWNDLEPPAFINIPLLQTLKEDLMQVEGFHHVLMSGSGTSIFCIGEPVDRTAFDAKFGQREDLQVFFSEFIQRPEGQWFERP